MHPTTDKLVCPTGLAWVDRYLDGGLRRGDTLLITGDWKAFKTDLGAMLALRAAEYAGGALAYIGGADPDSYLRRLERVSALPKTQLPQRLALASGWAPTLDDANERAARLGCGLVMMDAARNLPDLITDRRGSGARDRVPMVIIDGTGMFCSRSADTFVGLRSAIAAATHTIVMRQTGQTLLSMLVKARGQVCRQSDARIWRGGRWERVRDNDGMVSRTIMLADLDHPRSGTRKAQIARLLSDGGDAVGT